MGRTECARHGRSGVALVCAHLEDDVRARRALSAHGAYPVELEGDRILGHHVCYACIAGLALPVPAPPLSADRRLPAVPVCVDCYREATASG